MYRITVMEISPMPDSEGRAPEEVKRFEQTVDVLDMSGLIAAVNRKPRKPRAPKETKKA